MWLIGSSDLARSPESFRTAGNGPPPTTGPDVTPVDAGGRLAGAAAVAVFEPAPQAPAPRAASTRTTAVATFSLLSSMAFSTPSVRAATLAEITPAAICPAANAVAAWMVEEITAGDTPAEAALPDSSAANAPLDS